MKGKILVSLFALPFFCVGVWMLWSIGSTLFDAWQMRDWVQVDARVMRGGYATNSGDDSDTFEAYAVYTYQFGGERYQNDRVALSGGGDNIGDYQRNMGRRLSSAARSGATIIIFVDPDQPAASIIDRDIRWGLLGFKSIFLFVFGGVGLGLLIFVWRTPPAKDVSEPRYQESPWLLNDAWQTATIRSSSKTAMWGAWAFAAFWNLISIALPFLLYEEVTQKQNYIALVGLLFPLVGIGLLAWAIRRTLEWRRFGAAPVTLDPFPGSIGGHVGGTIDLHLPYEATIPFQLTLTNIHSYMSGSGKDRSRREKAKWQDALVAHATPGGKGTRLTFRFDVPEGLDASDAETDDSYHLWRLNLKAELPGTDLDRDYELPVYATAQPSRFLSDRAVQSARARQSAIDEESIRKVFELEFDTGGKRMLYPMGRYFKSTIGGFIIGSIFAAAGWYLIVEEGAWLFGAVFGAGGAFIALFCLYLMFNSLEVAKEIDGIRTVRRWLGIPISRKRMHLNTITRLEKHSSLQTQSGGKHVMHYSIHVRDKQGNKMVVGEGFKGENEARAAMRFITREFGLPEPPEREPAIKATSLGADVLTADR